MDNKKKVLIVDDDPVTLEVLEARLKRADYQVLKADNGAEAARIVKVGQPDLIILDVMMPEMDGYTFVREIKKDEANKDIPIIILSAKGKMKDLFGAEGVEDYLEKPFDPDKLLGKIKSYLTV